MTNTDLDYALKINEISKIKQLYPNAEYVTDSKRIKQTIWDYLRLNEFRFKALDDAYNAYLENLNTDTAVYMFTSNPKKRRQLMHANSNIDNSKIMSLVLEKQNLLVVFLLTDQT